MPFWVKPGKTAWKGFIKMISANNVTLRIGKKALFEDVNIKFTQIGRAHV